MPSQLTFADHFVWARDLEEYLRLAARGGALPVLVPPEPRRRARWTAVLDWYAARGAAISMGGGDLVVALGSEYAAPAEAFARTVGRPYRRWLQGQSPRADVRSMLIVAAPRRLPRATLEYLARKLPCRWGVVTARDLPGITFALAKVRFATAAGPMAVVDAVERKIYEIGDDGRPADAGTFTPERMDAIRCGDWAALALAGHGDCGHLNLRSVVLCGLVSDVERTVAGEAVGGCATSTDGAIRCKRAPDGRTALPYGALRSAHIGIYSCSCASVAGEPHGTSVSAVLSAADGYAASTLATDRVLVMDPWEPDVALAALRGGAGLGAVTELLNDLQERRIAARPYILYGDPAGPGLEHTAREDGGEVLLSGARGLAVVQAVKPYDVIAFSPRVSGVRVLPVGCALLVTSSAPAQRLRVAEMRPELMRRLRWCEWISRRMRRAPALEQALGGTLRAARYDLQEALAAALADCDVVDRYGGWMGSLDRRALELERGIVAWDRTAAESAGARVLWAASAGVPVARMRERGCPQCGAPVREERLAAQLRDQPDRIRAGCAACGRRWLRRTGEPAPKVTVTGPRTVAIDVPELDPEAWPGILVVELRDNVARRVVVRRLQVVPDRARELELTMQTDLTTECYTGSVTWVRAFDTTLEDGLDCRRRTRYQGSSSRPS